jgi:beta-lactamase regulating signal transducer with metallopeptidase domain
MISAANLIPFANHLWQSTLFGFAVWILTLTLRRNRAALRHLLWLAASIKFLIPFSLLVSLGARIPTHKGSISAAPEVSAVVETVSEPFVASYPTPIFVVPVDSAPPPQPQQSRVPGVLVSVWFLGFAGSVLLWLFRWRQTRHAVQEGMPSGLNVPSLPTRLIKHAMRMEPGVFGILRPVLLLPEGITDSLSEDELQSVIAHELCHVRRRDNMATAIHMIVESLFWFHPLVWWIKVRLLEEQERACDEEVLTGGANPRVYAESILKICKLNLSPPLTCIAGIAGSNLKQRIATIMRGRIGLRLSVGRKVLLTASAVMALAAPIAIGVVQAREERIEPQQTRVLFGQTGVLGVKLAHTQTASGGGRIRLQQPAAATVLAFAPTVQENLIRGSWEIEDPAMVGPKGTPFPNRIQLTFDGNTGKSFALDSLPFRGLTSTQIASPVRTSVQFEFETEAGNFVCEGEFASGVGKGSYVLYSDAGFLREMATQGFTGIGEQQLVSMALQGVGPHFISELRSAGITGTSLDQLMGLRAVGVTGEYIRAIQQAGYSPTADELISMWVQGVTPEFANQMRGKGQGMDQSPLPPSTSLSRTWAIDARTAGNGAISGSVQLTLWNPGGGIQSNGVPFDPSGFRGLTVAEIMSTTRTPVRFEIAREAGTFACEGVFQSGRGNGSFVFQPNSVFREQLQSLGIQGDDRRLFTMALQDVTLQFVRDIREVYPSASLKQLINMRVQNVTPDFVREIRELYPAASINDLINMRVQNTTSQFAREMHQLNPSISVRELVGMKVQTR